MWRKPILALAPALPVLVLSVLASSVARAAESLPPAAAWIPPNAVVALEIPAPRALLDRALDPKLTAAVTSLPVYQKASAEPGFQQFLAVVSYLEGSLGTDWKTGVKKLVGGGITLAAAPDGAVLLFVDAEDEKLLAQLHATILGFARGDAANKGESERIASHEYRGVTGWTFGKEEAHAIIGRRLVMSNRPDVLKAVLDLRAEPDGRSLASLPSYRAAKDAAGPDAAVRAFVNLEVVKQHPPVQKALTENENPLAALLFVGITEALRGSNWLALGLELQGDTLSLQAVVDGKAVDPSGPAAFALSQQPDQGAMPNLSVPRQIAGLSLFRDLHAFYAAKDDLFPERTSGLIFFENMMGIFFSGLDLTDEVLGETEPELRVVVAQQQYDPAVGTPQLQLPAFAAVFRLRNPGEFGEVVEEAWQKAIGLVNFTRGQQAQPGLIIDRLLHADVKYTMAYFRSPTGEDRQAIDSRFNFRPALAMFGDYLILSSTDGLAADLIDALNREIADQARPLAEAHSLLEVNSAQLASIFDANRNNMVRQNMLEKGSTQEQAEIQVDLIATVLKHLGEASLQIGNRQGQPRASLVVKLSMP
ncbi:MAG: hypothetical protein JXB62_12115 [Pirellulales bacterium]|nr:hypothetical protein [Pirellulales bacterium]